MIVDLMRNDLSRVAVPGSVAVPDLFTVETYPTIHQLTSTVTARLAPGKDAVDVIEALFPCGSITGAPKRRAMQVIGTVEPVPRGTYTGAIGRIDADGAMFNVAIRTLTLPAGGAVATLGLGSGIVADSVADREWAECLAKAAFVTASRRRFDLIETMAFDPEAGIVLLDRHLARMKAGADALGFAFDRHVARNELQGRDLPPARRPAYPHGPRRLGRGRGGGRRAAAAARAAPVARRGRAAAGRARRHPPAVQDQRPRLLRRRPPCRGHRRGRVRPRRLADRGQHHLAVRAAWRTACW